MKLSNSVPLILGVTSLATALVLREAFPVNAHVEERARGCENGPQSRNCWYGNFDINTDYENKWPNTGNVREYTLVVRNQTLAPDGISRQVLSVNGQIPGPPIEADWGDTIRVNVVNRLKDNGTSIHWHGVRQLNTNDQDGTNGITECPIAPGDSKTYQFKATMYGTSWYHSHFSSQYGDGVFGPIVIKGPTSANYDVDLGAITVNEWYHKTVFVEDYAAERTGPPTADNYLLNGMNANLNTPPGGQRFQVSFKKGKKYLLRFINTSVDNHFKVHIDNHNLTVISNDFVPIKPYTTDWVNLAIGQRYDVVVEANQDVSNYYLRAAVQNCGNNLNSGINGTAHGIVHYQGAPNSLPTTIPTTFVNGCVDEPLSSLVPVVSKTVDPGPFAAKVSALPVDGPNRVAVPEEGGAVLFRWSLNHISQNIDWSNPTLLQVARGDNNFSVAENIIQLPTANVWTYWIIQNEGGIAHPMHLHGHDFYVLGQGNGTFDVGTMMSQLNFQNPTRRDSVMLIGGAGPPGGGGPPGPATPVAPATTKNRKRQGPPTPTPAGWTVIAFLTDNPGAWLMHCHIAWHVGEGLSLQFLERASDLEKFYPGSELRETCRKWDVYDKGNYYNKTDSGLKMRRRYELPRVS